MSRNLFPKRRTPVLQLRLMIPAVATAEKSGTSSDVHDVNSLVNINPLFACVLYASVCIEVYASSFLRTAWTSMDKCQWTFHILHPWSLSYYRCFKRKSCGSEQDFITDCYFQEFILSSSIEGNSLVLHTFSSSIIQKEITLIIIIWSVVCLLYMFSFSLTSIGFDLYDVY